jgi:hypothetical protein
MAKIKKTFDWFKTKTATTSFAVVGLISGVIFLNYQLTGGVTLNKEFFVDPLSIVGSLLIICGIILGVYTIKKK